MMNKVEVQEEMIRTSLGRHNLRTRYTGGDSKAGDEERQQNKGKILVHHTWSE
jgi:hypothetical protein